MTRGPLLQLIALALLSGCSQTPPTPPIPSASTAARDGIFRGVLVEPRDGWPEGASLEAIRGAGHGAVAVAVNEGSRPEDVSRSLGEIEAAGLEAWLWIPVGRNPDLAARKPEWVGGVGIHSDWRSRFPSAPLARPGERVGVYPWTPIRYEPVLADRLERIEGFVKSTGARSVFLSALQGPPSACGCGNDQCRWTTDYAMEEGGPPQVAGSPPALLLAGLRKRLPGVRWVPVLVTECEEEDGPGRATGRCGTVECFKGLCWDEWSREVEPVLREDDGPVGLLLAPKPLGREKSGEPWIRRAFDLARDMPARFGRQGLPASRVYAVVQGGPRREGERAAMEEALAAGARGVLVALAPIDESWEPRIVPAVARPGGPGMEKHK